MNTVTFAALYGWLAVAILLFATLPPRRAMLSGLIGAWLFLPMAGDYYWLLYYTKINAVGLGLLLGVALFDTARLWAFRPRWFDLPVLVLVLCPAISTYANGLYSGYAGASTVNHILRYGVPYLMGRIYVRNLADLRELAVGVMLGGLVYVPLCLYEVRMSPQLHSMLYGFHQHDWGQTRRFGGFRPTVFMEHGLAVSMWMCAAALVGLGLWRLGRMRSLLWQLPMWLQVSLLVITVILCKSSGSWLLLGLGAGILILGRWGGIRWALAGLLVCAPLYMFLRGSGRMSVETVCQAASHVSSNIDSLRGRLFQEDVVVGRAMVHPLLGWGPWGEYRVDDERQGLVTATDGMWVILLGKYGMVGLASYAMVFLLPVILLVLRYRDWKWCDPAFAPVTVLSLVMVFYMLDCLANAMLNPVFVVVAGALASLAGQEESVLADEPCQSGDEHAQRAHEASAPGLPVSTMVYSSR